MLCAQEVGARLCCSDVRDGSEIARSKMSGISFSIMFFGAEYRTRFD
jgi:hypothetical protein